MSRQVHSDRTIMPGGNRHLYVSNTPGFRVALSQLARNDDALTLGRKSEIELNLLGEKTKAASSTKTAF